MKRMVSKVAAAGIFAAVLVGGSGVALAHHSYAMFDRTRTVTINGTVKLFQWTNPHMYLWVEVPNGKGGSDLYGIEGSSPNSLSRLGWSRNTLQPGEKVTVELQPLKDGRKGGFFVKATKADGTVVKGAAG